jgi:hypothetical protein
MVPNACDVWFRDVGLEPRTSRERTEFVLLTPGCAMSDVGETQRTRRSPLATARDLSRVPDTHTPHPHLYAFTTQTLPSLHVVL